MQVGMDATFVQLGPYTVPTSPDFAQFRKPASARQSAIDYPE